MVGKSLFLLGLLASSGAAFAVKQPPSFAARTSALPMSGGADGVPNLKPPASLYEGAVAAGAAKASAPWGKIFKLGVVSGAHIAFGAYLAIAVGGACPGIAQTNPGLQKVRTCYQHALKKRKPQTLYCHV